MGDFNEKFMKLAIEEAKNGLNKKGFGPFGACVVKDGEVIAVANNRVVDGNDPTAHAEISAIRKACQKLKSFELRGCELYITCEPCPMCLGAIYWCRLDKIYYGCNRHEAAEIGFDDEFIYEELNRDVIDRRLKTVPGMLQVECQELFKTWKNKGDRVDY